MKGDKAETKIQHISITPKSAITIVPPKKVSLMFKLCDPVLFLLKAVAQLPVPTR
jgi:hypothetical protein